MSANMKTSDVVLSASARREFLLIVEYLHSIRKSAADEFGFLSEFAVLMWSLQTPHHIHPRLKDSELKKRGYRKVSFSKYVLIYRSHRDRIEIVHIFLVGQEYGRFV